MPKSWWGKTILWTYVAGYWLYILFAALWSWSMISGFGAWRYYVSFQFLYALVWPVLLLLELLGLRW